MYSRQGRGDAETSTDDLKTIRFWVVSGIVAASMHIPELWLASAIPWIPATEEYTRRETFGVSWSFLVLLFQIPYFIASIKSQQPHELGGKLFFGKYIQTTKPGPIVAWAGIITHETENRSVQKIEIPKDLPEEKRGSAERDAEGTLYYRMTHNHTPQGQNMLFGDYVSTDPLDSGRFTSKVKMLVAWRVCDLEKFLTNAGGRENFLDLMRDSIIGETRNEFVKRTIGKTLQEWKTVEAIILDEIRELSQRLGYGVEIMRFQIKAIDLTREVNEAFSTQIAERVNVISQTHRGEGTKQRRKREGEGDAAVRQAFLTAEGEGFKMIKELLGITSEEEAMRILQSQTYRDAFKSANLNIISTQDIAGMIAAAQKVIRSSE